MSDDTTRPREAPLPGDQTRTIQISVPGLLYKDQGRYALAEPLFVSLWEAQRRVFGPRHARTERTMDTLGLVRIARKQYVEAEAVLRECDASRRQSSPGNFLRYATEAALDASLAGQRRYRAAEALLIAAWQGMKERQASADAYDRRRLQQAADWLIQLYKDNHEPAKAAEWAQNLRQLPATAR